MFQLIRTLSHLGPILCGIVLNNKSGVYTCVVAAWGLTGNQSVGGEQSHCASLLLRIYVFIIIIFPAFSVLLNCFISIHKFYLFFSFLCCSPPISPGRSEQTAVCCGAACWVKLQQMFSRKYSLCFRKVQVRTSFHPWHREKHLLCSHSSMDSGTAKI